MLPTLNVSVTVHRLPRILYTYVLFSPTFRALIADYVSTLEDQLFQDHGSRKNGDRQDCMTVKVENERSSADS